MLIIY
jgi:hypothetical protein